MVSEIRTSRVSSKNAEGNKHSDAVVAKPLSQKLCNRHYFTGAIGWRQGDTHNHKPGGHNESEAGPHPDIRPK